ncbi:hypothetical protein EAG_07821 [Camponotus floridanus]|uniref:Uncharacterized protein n=1 Tax=Camponotus floridanus TaxID=104421 RepID=E2AXM5_CAMFO|nr:hypothetical protein EAG_07821 [Camponotus floridanus]
MNLLLLINASRKSTALCTAERAILSGSRKKGLRHYTEITHLDLLSIQLSNVTLIREGGYRILTSSRGEISFLVIDRADLGMLRRREARLEIRGGNRPLAIGDDQKLCQERARPTAPNRGWCTPTTVMYTPTCRCLGATNTKSA